MNNVAPASNRSQHAFVRAIGLQIGIDVVLPLVVYYVARAMGASVLAATLVSGVLPALRVITTAVRQRKADVLGLMMVSLFLVSGAVSVLEGNPRLLFARDGWLTGALGVWALLSLRLTWPFMLHLGRAIAALKRGDAGADVWEQRWTAEPEFRHHLQVVSIVVGVVLIVDAVVRIVIAYSLPLDSIPLATNVQYFVMLGGLLAWFFPYTARHDLRA
jgi:hypothetical protein